jgi:hypothetical protein
VREHDTLLRAHDLGAHDVEVGVCAAEGFLRGSVVEMLGASGRLENVALNGAAVLVTLTGRRSA